MDRTLLLKRLEKLKGNGTQKDLAARLGISTAFLSDILNGNREPGLELLDSLGLERRVTYAFKRTKK